MQRPADSGPSYKAHAGVSRALSDNWGTSVVEPAGAQDGERLECSVVRSPNCH